MRETTFAFQETMNRLLDAKKYATLRDILVTMNPADIAMMFEDIAEDKLPLLFRLLPKEQAAETFVEMDSEFQEMLIRGFSDNELKEVVDELYIDDAVDIVEEMPANVVKRILRQADPEKRKMINEILKYPEDSAGSIMTTEYVSLRPKMTAADAIKRIRRTGVDKETIYTCYVTRDDKVLIGYVSLKRLLLSEEESCVEEIMGQDTISVTTTTDQEEVVQTLSKYDLPALPVVDHENRLVGIVTVDDAMDIMEEEATEDIEKMVAILPSDREYLRTSAFDIWKARVPWLLFLMLSATITSKLLQHYELRLAAQSALIAFIPMLTGTGGNAGAQASTTIIRGLSLNEIKFADVFRVTWKEIRVAVMCGVTLAAANFVKMMLVDNVGLMVSLVVSLTLVGTVLMAKLVGSLLPILAKRLRLDPAVLSSPFITTMVDAISLVIYFQIAILLLHI